MNAIRSAALMPVILASPVCAQSIEALGPLPGHYASRAQAISGDGSTVAGYSDLLDNRTAMRWTSAGLTALEAPVGSSRTEALAVSRDGTLLAGVARLGDPAAPYRRALRWGPAGMLDLGLLSGLTSAGASGISPDGSVVVGGAFHYTSAGPSDSRAFRWTEAGGMQDLGVLPGMAQSWANAVSGDNSTIVGASYDSWETGRAFRWTAQSGLIALDLLPGAWRSLASAVSGDGLLVAGTQNLGNWESRAVLWTGTAVQELGSLPGVSETWARGMTPDGALIVGDATGLAPNFGARAVVWNHRREMVALEPYAASLGIDLSNWVLHNAMGVSDDGMTIVGLGRYQFAPGAYRPESWVLTIPGPGAIGLFALGGMAAGRRRR